MKDVAASFLSLLRTNKMLAVEMLFEFPSKDLKDAILSNYEQVAAPTAVVQVNNFAIGENLVMDEPNDKEVLDMLAEQDLSPEELAALQEPADLWTA